VDAERPKEFLRMVYGSDEDARLKRFSRSMTALLADASYDDDETDSDTTEHENAGQSQSDDSPADTTNPTTILGTPGRPTGLNYWRSRRRPAEDSKPLKHSSSVSRQHLRYH